MALQADFNAIMEQCNFSYIQQLFKLQWYNTKIARPYVLQECLNEDLRDNPSPELDARMADLNLVTCFLPDVTSNRIM
ncbi:hypothetical protein RhiirA5_413501 [Rhizophagus irregularis]|uniref:Uncharacterized protein n=1 Tax=Rhizophagus irregularis TaxID=588596 RepID=A0A2I1FAU6_9GLOM|nr:hypothetical protein RhiirA5_413501 [Rhizophagus irregularis]PKC69239.1 hypothetical protein RhiirA1_456270 [Rhizophagus irregularis]PKY31488.1 hypothetical protein RhiirB3_449111 [Rhizophagus irregularis]